MGRALELARLGEGHTKPNPMVGAVIVHSDRIIGEGYHRRYGGPHAEVWAVRSVAEEDKHLLSQSTVYVTLEPCSHYGKTPPCALMLSQIPVRRVVVGCADPNPKVSGRGMEILREAGVEVCSGVLEKECKELNRPFMTAQIHRRPYIFLKWAMSADGYMDVKRDASESPLGISSRESQQYVHMLRSRFQAIMVGADTVLRDNPRLDVRLVSGNSPIPVVVDRRGRVPSNARFFSDGRPVIYFTSMDRSDLPASTEVVKIAACDGFNKIVGELYARGIQSLMVEGGSRILSAAVESGLWDDARIEVSGKILGDRGYAHINIPDGILESVQRVYGGNNVIQIRNRNFPG